MRQDWQYSRTASSVSTSVMTANITTELAPSAMSPTTLAKPIMRTSIPASPVPGVCSASRTCALQTVRHLDRIDRLALRVLLEHDRAHQRAGEVVGHQAPDDARLPDVVAHARHVAGVGVNSAGMTLPASMPSSTTSR